MLDLFNAQAADCAIAGVVTPTSDGLTDCIQGWTHQRPFRVCSGGTTSAAAQPQAWTIDMRPGFHTLDIDDNAGTVTIGAGCCMAEVLERLATVQRTLPAGLRSSGHWIRAHRRHGPLEQTAWIGDRPAATHPGSGATATLSSCHAPQTTAPLSSACNGADSAVRLRFWVLSPTSRSTRCPCGHWRTSEIEPEQLPQWMQRAEQGSLDSSLQWSWGAPDTIRTLAVQTTSTTDSSPDGIEGLHRLPGLAPPPNQRRRLHAEVVGLLGPACGDRLQGLINPLKELMDQRPDPGCQLACQQLGGATARVSPEVTSFVHRDAIWKPWITATWPAGNARTRETSAGSWCGR